jgi:hypothetical protein
MIKHARRRAFFRFRLVGVANAATDLALFALLRLAKLDSQQAKRHPEPQWRCLGEYCAQHNLGRIRIDDWLLVGNAFPDKD